MISDLLSATVIIGIISSGIRLATPYLFASIGEMFGQRSGVLNLGVKDRCCSVHLSPFTSHSTRKTYGLVCSLPWGWGR